MNWFYLSTFYSVLTFLYFYTITNFYSQFHHYCYNYFCYYCFCHFHCHYYFFIFNAFNFSFCSFYHSILSLYILNIFKFQTNDVSKHCSKLAIKTLRLYQCLWWDLWTLFAQLILLTIFIWSYTIIFCPWQLFLLFCKHFLIYIYYVAELSVFSFVIWLHNDKASDKEKNICDFSKLCVFFLSIYLKSHI